MLEKLRYLTAGESHGKGLLGILDGIPANLQISEDYGISWDENVRRIGAKSHAKEFVQYFAFL